MAFRLAKDALQRERMGLASSRRTWANRVWPVRAPRNRHASQKPRPSGLLRLTAAFGMKRLFVTVFSYGGQSTEQRRRRVMARRHHVSSVSGRILISRDNLRFRPIQAKGRSMTQRLGNTWKACSSNPLTFSHSGEGVNCHHRGHTTSNLEAEDRSGGGRVHAWSSNWCRTSFGP